VEIEATAVVAGRPERVERRVCQHLRLTNPYEEWY
jgi:hypothetical protein